jgi:hypothetical protein
MLMMQDWATSLVEQLGPRAQQVRIRPGMSGEEFEAALGKFLAFATALPLVSEFGHFGSQQVGMGKQMDFTAWWTRADAGVQEVTQSIRVNLFECFNRNRVDDTRATNAYGTLHHDGLGWDSDTRIWHATTNFDPAIEVAIAHDKSFELVDGFTNPPGGGTRILSPDLFESAATSKDRPNQVPVECGPG